MGFILTVAALAAILLPLASTQTCQPAIKIDKQPQIFIMSDINNEPDDAMSFVRALLHADQYNITGMVAVTSYWLNSSVVPEQILNLTDAYGQVVDNLNRHSEGRFPTAEYLSSIVKAGHPVYGTAAIGKSPLSSGAEHLISVVDGMSDDAVLHCQAWGGMSLMGETLAHVQRTRTAYDLDKFIRKLRIYTISDQDNAGPWVRQNFPSIPYIVSIHGWNQYSTATWTGISGEIIGGWEEGGPDSSLVTNAYVKENFQIGPLGSHYPDIAFIMEGDSPSLMHTFQNGLNGGPFDHPEWGGWGGRYTLLDNTRQTMVFSDTVDRVVGVDGRVYTSNHATIWRWRKAFQDEMAARVRWSVEGEYEGGSHPPVVAVNGSCGSAPLSLDVNPEQDVLLDASATYDPDEKLARRNALEYHWFQYREVTAVQANGISGVPQLNFTVLDGGRRTSIKMPQAIVACPESQAIAGAYYGLQDDCQQYHIILEVVGSGSPPIRRYKRVILKMKRPEVSGDEGRDEL